MPDRTRTKNHIAEKNSASEKNSAEISNPKGATGPRTPEGKAVSSQNSYKHGLRSEKIVLRDEDPNEFEATVQGWFQHYQPGDDEIASALVAEVARCHWFLKRANQRLEEVEFNLPGNGYCWTDSQQQLFANFTRYRTTAERSFLRFYKEVEAYYGKQFKQEMLKQRAFARLAAVEVRWCRERERLQLKHEHILKQWVDIEIDSAGVCVTRCFPSNEQVIEQASKLPAPVRIVVRILEFKDGVPPEYAWTNATHVQKMLPSMSRQSMLYEDWLKVIEHEAELATGHIGPILPTIIQPPHEDPPA